MKLKSNIVKYAEPLLLSILWLTVFAAPFLISYNNDDFTWSRILMAWKQVVPFFIVFLINHFLLVPYLLFKNKRITYIISAIVVVIVFSFFSNQFGNKLPEQPPLPNKLTESSPPPPGMPGFPGPPHLNPPPVNNPPANPFQHFINSVIVAILVIGFDMGIKIISRWSKLEYEKTLLEKQNVQNQLAFLRNQLSPHFFMNTLNNIHVLIDINTEEAKEAVIKLSKLMRHLLYDSDSELVELSKEIEFIVSYINLMKLRFSEKVDISLIIPDEIPHKKIPPLLFTSFVENAFKHGISYQEYSFIAINFEFEESELNFEIKNRKQHMAMDEKDSGIGLDNSVKRLDLLYGKAYSLTVDEEDEIYKLKLSIPL